MRKDIELLSIKIALDNAILEYRALKEGTIKNEDIPSIEL